MSEWTEVQTVEFELAGITYELATRMRVKPVDTPAEAPRPSLRERADPPRRPTTGHPQPRADLEVAFKRSDQTWEIECPEHGWHAAVEFAASGDMPAVVKCTAKVGEKHCNQKVPLQVAERKVGRR